MVTRLTLLLLLALISIAALPAWPVPVQPAPAVTQSPAPVGSATDFARQKMINAKMDPLFISAVEQGFDQEQAARILELNLLGFLGHADYSGHFSARAIRKCREFMRSKHSALLNAQTRYGVAREVVTALLWVETKHGKTMGHLNVAGVFFTLLQADFPDHLLAVEQTARLQAPDYIELAKKIQLRAAQKSDWALAQLEALEKVYLQKNTQVMHWRGSYAGAFGVAQFIPSSYVSWAKARRPSRRPDLFETDDAISSVAFYLHTQGWKENDARSQHDALFHYNASEGYVAVILKLAHAI